MSFLALLFTHFCFAGEIPLFAQNHQRIEGYDQLIRILRPGNVLRFSNDKTFMIDGILGNGGTTEILALRDPGKALRIPLSIVGEGYMNSYIDGAKYLAQNHIPSVRVFETREGEYAVVERLYDFMTFSQFVDAVTRLESPGILDRLSLRSSRSLPVEEMKKNFLIFAEQMAFSKVDDMHSENLVYDFQNHRWLLLDWAGVTSLRYQAGHQLLFEEESPLKELVEPYGRTSGLQFQAVKDKYGWLQDMMAQAHAVIDQKQQSAMRAGFCSRVFFR